MNSLITQEKRMQVYESLPEEIQRVYSSESAATLNKKLVEKYSISEDFINAFLDTTGDVILGFYKIADLPRLLQKNVGMSADEAQRMTSELIEFLEPVVKREETEAMQKKEDMQNLAHTFENRPPESKPSETEEGSIPQVRTMGRDISRIHGYGAVQNEEDDESVVHATSQEETLTPKQNNEENTQ